MARRGVAAQGLTAHGVVSARVLSVDHEILVAELHPGGERLVFRGADDGWRLVRFADGDDCSVRPETTRRVPLRGSGPDAVLAALGLTRPHGVEMEVVATDLGQGQTETRCSYRWTEGGRAVLADEVTTEVFDGATPRSTQLRGLIVDGDRGVLLTGRDGFAVIVEG